MQIFFVSFQTARANRGNKQTSLLECGAVPLLAVWDNAALFRQSPPALSCQPAIETSVMQSITTKLTFKHPGACHLGISDTQPCGSVSLRARTSDRANQSPALGHATVRISLPPGSNRRPCRTVSCSRARNRADQTPDLGQATV